MKIAVPNKGRLHEGTLELLRAAGYTIRQRQRALSAICSDERTEVHFARASDIPHLLQAGVVDLGITGRDLALESGAPLNEILALGFGAAELVLAAPQEPFTWRIATRFPNLARAYCAKRGVEANIVELDGAIELAPRLGIADAIIDLSSSGETLRSNGLQRLDTVLETECCLYAKNALSDESHMLIKACESVLAARGKKFLLAHVPKEKLEEVRRIVPGLSGPTLNSVYNHKERCAIQVVVDQERLPRVIYELKSLGAEGILVTSLERVIY